MHVPMSDDYMFSLLQILALSTKPDQTNHNHPKKRRKKNKKEKNTQQQQKNKTKQTANVAQQAC